MSGRYEEYDETAYVEMWVRAGHGKQVERLYRKWLAQMFPQITATTGNQNGNRKMSGNETCMPNILRDHIDCREESQSERKEHEYGKRSGRHHRHYRKGGVPCQT